MLRKLQSNLAAVIRQGHLEGGSVCRMSLTADHVFEPASWWMVRKAMEGIPAEEAVSES